MHPPLGTFRRPPELVYRTEPAAAACNCIGSQQLCHSCSRSLLANDNDHAHSLECASTAEDLQEVPRICQTSQAPQTLQAPHPALIHKSQWGQGATDHPICFHCFLRAMMTTHALWDMHPPLGTLKWSPELPNKLRLTQNLDCCHIHTHVWHWGTTCPFCSLIMSGNDNARSLEHATTTEDTQEVPRACQVPHKLHLPLHYLLCVVHTNCRAPSRLGGTAE